MNYFYAGNNTRMLPENAETLNNLFFRVNSIYPPAELSTVTQTGMIIVKHTIGGAQRRKNFHTGKTMTMMHSGTNRLQKFSRISLGVFMVLAAIAHLSFGRKDFQAQVPDWVPLNKDLVVILSGIVELAFGAALIFWKKQRIRVGIALAIFYILIFPGNIAQYVNHTDAFGLTTDKLRFIRLFFQPVLILWALWCTGALVYLFKRHFVKSAI